jgi:hypothetical protein
VTNETEFAAIEVLPWKKLVGFYALTGAASLKFALNIHI